MKKLHNKPVQVPLTEDDIWTLLKLFRDGEETRVAPELEAKFITAYHQAKLASLKEEKATHYIENTPDIEEMLGAAENFMFADNALIAAWDAYILAIQECDAVTHYEPLPYQTFASVLNEFVKNYDMTPAMERIAREAETLPFELKASDWTKKQIEQALVELQEMKAGLHDPESSKVVPVRNRVQAIDTSIKAIETVRDAYEHAIDCPDPYANKIIEIEPTARAAWAQIKNKIQALHRQYTEDLEHLQAQNEMGLPIGDTIQEGKAQGVFAVLALMSELEDNFK